MGSYILRRLALMPLTILGVTTAVFLLVRLLPGDIVTVIAAEAPQYGGADKLRAELGFDRSLPEQYLDFVTGAARGDFGDSLYFRRPVSEDLARAIPVTFELAVLAVIVSTLFALPLGVFTAVKRNHPFDHVVRGVSVVFSSIPTFWLGTLLLTALGVWFAWTPPLRYVPPWEDPSSNLAHFAFPTIVLAVTTVGLNLRLVRSQMVDVLGQDYIRTARAKGLPPRAVIGRHGLRNALIPVVAIVANQLGVLLGGAAITETIFNLPGLGRLLIEGVSTRDYPTVQAVVLVIALSLVFMNLVVDLLYAWLDPRIRYA